MKRILVHYAILFLLFTLATAARGADAPTITKEELKGMLDRPDLIIIDVRTGASWGESELKIKGAVREEPTEVKRWIDKYPKDKTLVFY